MVDEETLEYLKESMADILDVMDMLHKEVSNYCEVDEIMIRL